MRSLLNFTPCALLSLNSNIIAISLDCGCKVRYFFKFHQIFFEVFFNFFSTH